MDTVFMLKEKKVLDNVNFTPQKVTALDAMSEVISGLKKTPKFIGPKYFYDTVGSELFEKITQTPEYYVTRTERGLLTHYAQEIAGYCGEHCVLIEPGSGSSEKIRLLLDA